jgi:hypothetical protein
LTPPFILLLLGTPDLSFIGTSSKIAIMSTMDEKLGALEGEHGEKSKMQELTENSPSGLKGLMRNRYATTVAISIGFGGLLYGYPSVSAIRGRL